MLKYPLTFSDKKSHFSGHTRDRCNKLTSKIQYGYFCYCFVYPKGPIKQCIKTDLIYLIPWAYLKGLINYPVTVMPTKSDSDVILCLQFETLTLYTPLELTRINRSSVY